MPDHSSPAAIRSYYDQNTRLFLRFGSSNETQTIHRAVWAEGIQTLEAALNYSNEMVLDEARRLSTHPAGLRLVDLGCGVGASLFYLLTRLGSPVRGVGLTISSLQAHLARDGIPAGLEKNCQILEGDFHQLPLAPGYNLAYSIEAYVHASNPEAFLREAARILAPGGRLVICDDFLSASATRSNPRSRAWLAAYQDGWYVPNLRPVAETVRRAAEFGMLLHSDRNLTTHLRLRSLPDALAGFLLSAGQRLPQNHPIIPSMLGSMALQQCLKAGLVEYHFLVFEKPEA